MQCTDCSHNLIEQSLFCDDCGSARAAMLQDADTLRVYCGKCGTRLQGERKYCVQCGEPSPLAGGRRARKKNSLLALLSDPRVQLLLLGACLAVFVIPVLVILLEPEANPYFREVTSESVAASVSTEPKAFKASQAHLEAMALAGLRLQLLGGVAKDSDGTIYVADPASNRVHKIGPDGKQTVVAGTGKAGFSGDFGPAREATLNRPRGLMFDQRGRLFIADSGNQIVRMIDRRGEIRTIAGLAPGELFKPGAHKDAARRLTLLSPIALGLGLGGEIYVTEDPNAAGPRSPTVWVLEPDARPAAAADDGRAEVSNR